MGRPPIPFIGRYNALLENQEIPQKIRTKFLYNNGNVGIWAKIRCLYEYLNDRNQWTALACANHLYLLLLNNDKASLAKSIEGPMPNKLIALMENDYKESVLYELDDWVPRIEDTWHLIGSEDIFGLNRLLINDRNLLKSKKFSNYMDLSLWLEENIVTSGIDEAAHDLGNLLSVADFAAKGVLEQRNALAELCRFLEDANQKAFAVVGRPATGKSGLFKAMYVSKYVESRLFQKPVIYIDMSKIGSFVDVVDNINRFLFKQIDRQAASRPPGDPLETKLRDFVDSVAKHNSGFVFICTNIEAVLYEQGKFRIRDDRMGWLVRVVEAGQENKVILGILASEAIKKNAAGRKVDVFLTPPGWRNLKTFVAAFCKNGELDTENEEELKTILRRRTSVDSTVIIASLALLSMSSLTDKGTLEAVQRASKENSPVAIISEILGLIACDKLSLTLLAFVALSHDGVREQTLVKFLRYHRHISPTLRNLPKGGAELSRKDLAIEDETLISEFLKRFSILVGSYNGPRPSRDIAGLADDDSNILHITSGLREFVAFAIEQKMRDENALGLPEKKYSNVIGPVETLIAREQRRTGMRARVANTSSSIKTAEEIQCDLDAASHLLASCRESDERPRLLARSNHLLESRYSDPAVMRKTNAKGWQIATFVLHQVIRNDIKIDASHAFSNVWLADDAAQKLLLRFFHLGASAPSPTDVLQDAYPLNEIPSQLLNCLPIDDIAWILGTLGNTAYRLQDYIILWRVIGLEHSLFAHGASRTGIEALQLLKLDTLISMGAIQLSFSYKNVEQEAAETSILRLMEGVGGFNGVSNTRGSLLAAWLTARKRARCAAEFLRDSPERLRFRAQLISRLAEICELSGRDEEALYYFLEAESLDSHCTQRDNFPVLSGAIGRKALRFFLRRAVNARSRLTARSGDGSFAGSARARCVAEYKGAKRLAEDLHRRNLRRRSTYPSEHTGTLIDEALLERHIRGDSGRGDISKSYKILQGDREEILSLAAPRAERLEYFLERAKAALLLGSQNISERENLKKEARGHLSRVDEILSTWYVRDDTLFAFYDESMGLHPLVHRLEKAYIRAKLEATNGEDDEAGMDEIEVFEHLGFRKDLLFSLADPSADDDDFRWVDEPCLA